jgi:hypothetical protein
VAVVCGALTARAATGRVCAAATEAVAGEARTVAVRVMVTWTCAAGVLVPTRLIAAVARAAIDSATANHPAMSAAALGPFTGTTLCDS